MFTKGIIAELLWFLSGNTDANVLKKQGVHIWDGNTSREFLDKQGFKNRPEGQIGPSYSFQFRHAGAKYIESSDQLNIKDDPNRVDQVERVINSIKNDPYGRRHIIDLWNVSDLSQMSLPPCLFLYQFYVSKRTFLNCSIYQRSADMGLGVPFNIASASILTMLIAKLTNLQAGELIHQIGDAHIYTDHEDSLIKQLQRTPRPFPILELNPKGDYQKIEDFRLDDFTLKGYYPYEGLKMKMAV